MHLKQTNISALEHLWKMKTAGAIPKIKASE